MKKEKLSISITLLMVLSVLMFLIACGNESRKGAVVKSADNVLYKIYADSPSLSRESGVFQIPIIGEVGKSAGNADCSLLDLTLINIAEMKGSGYRFLNISTRNENACWAGIYWNFETPYDNTNASIRFSVKSREGGPTSIKAKIETAGYGGARESEEISKSFLADNKWHELTFPIVQFSAHSNDWRGSNYNLKEGIYTVVIALDDTDGKTDNGIGKQTIDIDEVLLVE